MKKAIFIFLVITLLAGFSKAETANELAVRIIKSQPMYGYNTDNDSQEDMPHSHVLNPKMRLDWLMVNDTNVSEEVRICYALRLLDKKIMIHKTLRSGMTPLPIEELMIKQRLTLGARLSKISNVKKGNAD